MQPPNFPVAMGVIFRDPGPAYDEAVYEQIADVTKKSPAIPINELMHKGKTWTVV
jgi:2-oxoglutarate ferredoxin oxidoreductase subunit beta